MQVLASPTRSADTWRVSNSDPLLALPAARELVERGLLSEALEQYQQLQGTHELDDVGRRIAGNAVQRLTDPGPTGQWAVVPPEDHRDEFLAMNTSWLRRPQQQPPTCPVCLAPRRRVTDRACPSCSELRGRLGRVYGSIEAVTTDTSRGLTHSLIRGAKDQFDPGSLNVLAAAWSAYWAAHGPRIANNEDLVVRVPSTNALLDRLTRAAVALGWPVPALLVGGAAHRRSTRLVGREQRMAAHPDDWNVELDVEGRNVVVVDDVYVTGATAWTYGAALRQRGAAHMRLVVLEHCATGNVLAELPNKSWDAHWRRTGRTN